MNFETLLQLREAAADTHRAACRAANSHEAAHGTGPDLTALRLAAASRYEEWQRLDREVYSAIGCQK